MIRVIRPMLFLVIALFLQYTPSFAEGLATQEAVNYFNEGVKAHKDGDLERANACYQKTMILEPGNNTYRAFVLNNRGAIYMSQGDMGRAEEMFVEALRANPAYKPAQLNLGLVIEAKGDRVKALEFWAKVFDIDGQKPKTPVLEEQQKTENPALISGKAAIKN
ncbi:MAG: tetratricopeptide repeat protein [Candidatus Omnitrophota bacterium]